MFKDSLTNIGQKVNNLWNEAVHTFPNLSGFFGQAAPTDSFLKDGKLAFADGTNWNPNTSGKGWYTYNLTNTVWLKFPMLITKTTTGNPTYSYEGLVCINTFDNTVKIYADAGWRTIASGW